MGRIKWGSSSLILLVVAFMQVPSSLSQPTTKYRECESFKEWGEQIMLKNPNPLWKKKEDCRCKKI